ncbi:MAG: hypothetical protein ABMA64_25695 [Myxococcota bacterium]
MDERSAEQPERWVEQSVEQSVEQALADPYGATAIRVDDDEDPDALLRQLDRFPALRRLNLRCGLPSGVPSGCRPPPTLVELELVVAGEVETEVDQVCRAWPQLEHLEVWCAHDRPGALPPSVGLLGRLRELHVVSCGVSDLPAELAHATELRALVIRGCPVTTFPAVIPRLRLERLVLDAQLVGLPDALGEMSSLRSLDLTGALNKGLAGSDAPFVNPVPAVLGRLVGLESLGLGQCGVNDDLSMLAGLHQLRQLDVSWGPIADLSGLVPLTALEQLTMQSCYKALDLSPLVHLPRLRALDVSGNHYLKDVGPIARMAALEELDLRGCRKIASVQPVLDHPTLKVLRGPRPLLARWEQRQALAGTPPVAELLKMLESDELSEVTTALDLLSVRIQVDSGEHSAVFDVFGVTPEEGTLTPVPVLDEALERWGQELPSPTLLAVAKLGLVSITDDLAATVTAATLLAERRAELEQHELARQFHRACERYDSGHRAWDETVLDQLIEDVFPQLLPGPLLTLLRPLGTDALSSESGDAMDALFLAAFLQPDDLDEATRDGLVDRFCAYAEQMIEYEHAELVQRLHREIDAANPEVGEQIAERLGALSGQVALQAEVETARSPVAVAALLGRVLDPADALTFTAADEVSAFSGRVLAVAGQLPEDTVRSVLEASWTAGATGWDWGDLLGQRWAADPAAAEAHVAGWLAAHPDHQPTVLAQLRLGRRLRIRDAGEDAVAMALWAAEARLVGRAPDELRTAELGPLLLAFAQGHSDADWAAALSMLHTIGAQAEPVKTNWEHFSYLQMKFEPLVLMIEHEPEEYAPKVRAFLEAFRASLPRITWGQKAIETIAADAVGAAQLSNDEALRALAFSLVPSVPAAAQKDRLAFNVACFYAVRGEREPMLAWAARAVALGKPPAQFHAEADFAAFRTDPDFVALVGR